MLPEYIATPGEKLAELDIKSIPLVAGTSESMLPPDIISPSLTAHHGPGTDTFTNPWSVQEPPPTSNAWAVSGIPAPIFKPVSVVLYGGGGVAGELAVYFVTSPETKLTLSTTPFETLTTAVRIRGVPIDTLLTAGISIVQVGFGVGEGVGVEVGVGVGCGQLGLS